MADSVNGRAGLATLQDASSGVGRPCGLLPKAAACARPAEDRSSEPALVAPCPASSGMPSRSEKSCWSQDAELRSTFSVTATGSRPCHAGRQMLRRTTTEPCQSRAKRWARLSADTSTAATSTQGVTGQHRLLNAPAQLLQRTDWSTGGTAQGMPCVLRAHCGRDAGC